MSNCTGGDGPGGISCLLAASDTPGLLPQLPERKMGMRSAHTATIVLDSARVPADLQKISDRVCEPGDRRIAEKNGQRENDAEIYVHLFLQSHRD